MHPGYLLSPALLILVALLPGCTTPGTERHAGTAGNPFDTSDIPAGDPHLDHIFAWIPRDRAKTAPVAEALVHIELGRAKDEVGKTYCGGDWLINGASVDSIGPYPSTAPAMLGGYPAWYYHISHEPGLSGCAAMPATKLYTELGNRLPPWITVRAASIRSGDDAGTAVASTLRQN